MVYKTTQTVVLLLSPGVDSACNGGLMDTGFAFAEKNAMCTEDSNSYTGTKGGCPDLSCTLKLAHGLVTGFRT